MAVCNEKSMWWFRGYDSYLLIELVWKQIWPLTRRCLDIFMFCNPQMCWTWCLIHFCSTSTAVWRHELIILWLNQEHFTLEAAEVHQIYCVVWLFLWKIDKLNCHQKGSSFIQMQFRHLPIGQEQLYQMLLIFLNDKHLCSSVVILIICCV